MNDVLSIPTEQPELEQWRLLNQLTFTRNIEEHLLNKGFEIPKPETIEFVAGCLKQSEAYFSAAKTAPIDISPLLLYYGTTNLLAGAAILVTGEKLPVEGHGMKLEVPSESSSLKRIADVDVKPTNATTGGLQLFANVFTRNCLLVNGQTWSVEELFASIAEVRQEFLMCYPSSKPFTIPIERLKTENVFLERVDPNDLDRFSSPGEAFSQVLDFKSHYLEPQVSNQMNLIPLRRKLGSPGLGQYSLFGNQFIQISHIKAGHQLNPSKLILMLMSLYALGFLSRYRPELWNPFVSGDTSGEILLISKLLNIAQRYIPNLVLDQIHSKRHRFVNTLDEVVDLTALSDLGELKKLIRDYVGSELNERGIKK